MRKTFLIPAVLAAAAGLSLAGFAVADESMGGNYCPHHHGGMEAMHMLDELDLSAAQRDSIHTLIHGAFKDMKSGHESMHALHRSFETAVPGTPQYATIVAQLADAEAAAAREHVQHHAEIKEKVYALLTDAQRTKLSQLIAQHDGDRHHEREHDDE
jgi:Spy/CpxP family protein refolding chaperone